MTASIQFRLGLANLREAHEALLAGLAEQLEATQARLRSRQWQRSESDGLRQLASSLVELASSSAFPQLGEPALALEGLLSSSGRRPEVGWRRDSAAGGQPLELAVGALCAAIRATLGSLRPGRIGLDATSRSLDIVDADIQRALVLERTLEGGGYRVDLHASQRSLSSALHARSPGAVIVALELLLDPAWRDALSPLGGPQGPPLVCVSAEIGMAARLAAVRAGCSAFFTSPPDPTSLLRRLDALTAPCREPSRVLFIEGGQLSARHGAALREAGFRVFSVEDPLHVDAALAEARPDLVVVEDPLPGYSGLEVARALRQEDATVGVPIVLVVAPDAPAHRLAALRNAAEDFVSAAFDPLDFVVAAEHRVRRARVLRALITHDGLTGLLNHTAILQRATVEQLRAERRRSPLAVAMLDVDHFKTVNDRYGHPAGDRVLQTLSRMLERRLRRIDVAGRYGGEEFLVLLPDTSADEARVALESVREAFARVVHPSTGGGGFGVTFSAGIAEASATDDLVSAADQALYEAKRAGRDRILVFGRSGAS